jgi:predicted NBD/HSP70 family sugar kinase
MDLYKFKKESENKRNVLNTVFDLNRKGIAVSRSCLSEKTGLSLATVIRFVSEFIADGIIEEFDELESTGGRKPLSLRINPDYAYVISVDIGTFSAKIGIVKINGQISHKEIIPVKDDMAPTVGLTLEELYRKLDEIIAGQGSEKLLGIAVGISGMVNCREGRIIFCPNISGWDNVPIVDLLSSKYNTAVFLDTSPRCMALAEQWFGAGKDIANQIFASFGYGSIGSGIIIDNRLFRGSGGFAGELGHVQVVSDGLGCTCGNFGCIEMYVTLPMMIKKIKADVRENAGYSPVKFLVNDISEIDRDTVIQALKEGDKIVREVITEAGKFIGIALANMANLFNPELIVLGGGVIESFPEIVDEVDRTIKKKSLVTIQKNLKLKQSALGWDASIIGGAILVLQEFFA